MFLHYGILLWQDGTRQTGALAIPYPNAALAEAAIATFKQNVAGLSSASAGKPFDQLLPARRTYSVVPAGGRSVAVLAFERIADPAGKGPRTFLADPHKRLFQMLEYRDLEILIGRNG